jgi:hypothetical protein
MAAFNMTNQQPVFKTVWPQDEVEAMAYTNRPLYAMMTKQDNWEGEYQDIVLKYSTGGGKSASWNTARANKRATSVGKFHIPSYDYFELWSVDHKTMWLSRNKKGAVYQILRDSTEQKLEQYFRARALQVWGNGGGALGRLISTQTMSSTTWTLRDPLDIINFELGDIVVLGADDGTGGGGVRAGTAVEITAITPGETTSTFTASAAPNTFTSATANDYIFIEGDYGAWMPGISAYIPKGTPAALHGLTRTTYRNRMAGIPIDLTGKQVRDGIKRLLTFGGRLGARVTDVFISPERFEDLDLDLGTQLRYSDAKVGTVGFTGIKFNQTKGAPVNVWSDPDIVDVNDCYGLHLADYKLRTAGEDPIWMTVDGSREWRIEDSNNALEGRIGGYGAAILEHPGWHCVGGFNGLS